MSESWWPYHYYVGEVVYPPNATYGPRIQQDYQLVMLHTGSLTLSVDSDSYSFDAGVVILLHPGHTEFFRFSPNSRTHHSWICVRGPEMPPNLLKTINQLPRAIPLSQRMNYLAQEAVYWNQAVVRPKHLLLSIASNAFFLYLEEASGAGTSLRKECEAVSIVKQYIHRHYDEHLTLDDLGRLAAISAEHLCRLFKTQCGIGPIAYLWQYRTHRALDLFTATGLSVVDIAKQCGFKTPYHLNRKVKETTGMTPIRYRKQYWHCPGK